ncbi:MAG: DUF4388 domain-containing protein [Actinobacteria bacterium]|nr:DUF4388 domain-containing protein [Actinomycetota bacterium]
MILWGRIQDFSIFAVLQFLAQYKKSGVLEIQDFEEYGSVFLTKGRVDAISLPLSDDLLGKRLVTAGALTEEQLRECLLEAHERDVTEPLGLLLLRRGYTDRATLQEIVNKQIHDQALELSNWRSGSFKFTIPERPIQFPITPSIDVQTLLLDASRRLDEGDRPRREKIVVEEEICLTCTVECNEHIKARFLKNDVCLWRNMPAIAKDHLFPGIRRGRRRPDEEDDFQDLPFL